MKNWIFLLTFFAWAAVLQACDSAPAEPFRQVVQSEYTGLVAKVDKSELIQLAYVILRGVVTAHHPEYDSDSMPVTDTDIEVLEVFKGKPEDVVAVRTKGRDPYREARFDGRLSGYLPGDEVILFLTDQKGERPDKDEFDYFVVGMGQGAFLLEKHKGKKQIVSKANEEYGFTYKSFKKQLKQLEKENRQTSSSKE